MANIGHVTVTLSVSHTKLGRTTFLGPFKDGFECPECKHLEDAQEHYSNITRSGRTCPVCGLWSRRKDYAKEPSEFSVWTRASIRWIRTKTGYWPWQTEGHWEKRVNG